MQDNLKEQAEAGRANAQQLSAQASRQQEAGEELARESVEAYTRFPDAALSRYRAGTEQAAGNVQEGARTLSETVTGLVGAAIGAAVIPIANYDEMNVEEVSKHLNDLSVEELRLVRDYEERNKKRETLLEQMDRKFGAE